MIHRPLVQKLDSSDSLIAHCRQVIGECGEGLSDEEIDELRRNAEAMARVLIAMFSEKCAPTERP